MFKMHEFLVSGMGQCGGRILGQVSRLVWLEACRKLLWNPVLGYGLSMQECRDILYRMTLPPFISSVHIGKVRGVWAPNGQEEYVLVCVKLDKHGCFPTWRLV